MALSQRILVYVSLIAVVFAAGISGTYLIGHYEQGFNVPINSLLTAAYYTTITLSTVGFGDIVPVTNTARIFTIVLIITGIGIFLGALTSATSEIVNTRVEYLAGRINPFEKRLLKNHVILVGMDNINMRLAEKLKEKNIKFIVLSSDVALVKQFRDQKGYRAFVVDETDEKAMSDFEPERAKSIIIDMNDKSRMVYALLIIRNLAENSRIVAIARNHEEEIRIRGMGLGIGVISPAEMASNLLSQKIEEL